MADSSKELSIKEIKSVLLDMIEAFHEVCEANGLRYYLCGGTLLGAARHKGFIPWDDDADVFMPRPDYMRFVELTKGGLGTFYQVKSHYFCKNYTFPFIKICDSRTVGVGCEKIIDESLGVALDVFPIDGISSNDSVFGRQMTKVKYLRRLSNYSRFRYASPSDFFENNSKRHFIHNAVLMSSLFVVARLFGYGFFVRQIDKCARKNDYDASEMVGVVVWGYYHRERIPKDCLEPYAMLPFETRQFRVPGKYHEYLTSLYGDYMTPPPPDKRKSDHNIAYYWKAPI